MYSMELSPRISILSDTMCRFSSSTYVMYFGHVCDKEASSAGTAILVQSAPWGQANLSATSSKDGSTEDRASGNASWCYHPRAGDAAKPCRVQIRRAHVNKIRAVFYAVVD